jgi:type VI secretion system protein ImpC
MEESGVPFDLIVLSELRPGQDRARAIRSVDKDALEALLSELSPTCEVPSAKTTAPVTIRQFRDFRPERLARQIPEAADLLDLRQRALDLASGKGSWPDLESALSRPRAHPSFRGAISRPEILPEAPAPPAPSPAPLPRPPSPAPSGGLFDLVDVEGSQAPQDPVAPADRRSLGEVIAAVVGQSGDSGAPRPAELRRLAEEIEKALGRTVRTALHAPAFRRLEGSWRGLRYLVQSLDFRSGLKLHVAAVPASGLLEAVREAATPLADELRSQGRVAALLLDFEFDDSEESLETAGRIARSAAPRSLPVLGSFSPGGTLLGLSDRALDPTRAGWKRLRELEASRWLVLAENRILLRSPYGQDLDPVREFGFEEGEGEASPYLWGNPVWLLGALVGRSFARTGWGVDFAGVDSAQGLPPLPVRPLRLPHGEEIQLPLEELLGESAAGRLDQAGFLPLSARRNSDLAFAVGTAAVHKAGAGTPHASLRLALFSAHLGAKVESMISYLDFSKSPEELAKTLGAGLELLGLTESGPEFRVQARSTPGDPPAVKLKITPGALHLRGLPPIDLEVPLPLR